MARLLRQRIKDLEEKVNELENELLEWRKVGDCILKFYHWKRILKFLKNTKYFILMATYKGQQAEEEMKEKLDKALFGD